jgi:hypothetical protein
VGPGHTPTQQASGRRGRTLLSSSVRGHHQRAGYRGLAPDFRALCCYQAIRTLISHAADDAGLDPARISFTWARDASRSRNSDTGCFSPYRHDDLTKDLAFEITFARNLVPGRPGRRYEHKTKRPGGRYKTRKSGEITRLAPLTRIICWLMPALPA